MLSLVFVFWFVLVFVLLRFCKNLLLSLIVIELMTFVVLFFLSSLVLSEYKDLLVISLFCIFVMEGVIGLSGLIIIVNFSGRDYLKTSSIVKC